MMEVHKKLRAIREDLDITQCRLGEDIGISNQVICNIESGATNLDVNTFMRLAKGLGRKTWEILKEVEEAE